jgi:hypothetical protein
MVRRPFAAVLLPAVAVLATSCVLFQPGPRLGPLVEREFSVEGRGASDADVHVVFWGGKVSVASPEAAGDRIVSLLARDNLDQVEPRCDERREDRHVAARLWLDAQRGVLSTEERAENEWTLELGRVVPLDLDLGFAACEAEIDLGGAPLRRARISVAAGKATLRFSEPNPIELEQLAIEFGAGELRVEQLGNARCRSVRVEVAAGDFDLDLGGDWPESAFLRVDAGMGGIELRIPRDLAVRIDASDTMFGDVSAPDFVNEGDRRFVSPDLPGGIPRLTIDVEASFGSVVLVRD